MKFPVKDFFSKFDQIHSYLGNWSHLLKKSLVENFIFSVRYNYNMRNFVRCAPKSQMDGNLLEKIRFSGKVSFY